MGLSEMHFLFMLNVFCFVLFCLRKSVSNCYLSVTFIQYSVPSKFVCGIFIGDNQQLKRLFKKKTNLWNIYLVSLIHISWLVSFFTDVLSSNSDALACYHISSSSIFWAFCFISWSSFIDDIKFSCIAFRFVVGSSEVDFNLI